mgnify:CR=1 FL=1
MSEAKSEAKSEAHWVEALPGRVVDRVLDAVSAGKPFDRILREKCIQHEKRILRDERCAKVSSHDPNTR